MTPIPAIRATEFRWTRRGVATCAPVPARAPRQRLALEASAHLGMQCVGQRPVKLARIFAAKHHGQIRAVGPVRFLPELRAHPFDGSACPEEDKKRKCRCHPAGSRGPCGWSLQFRSTFRPDSRTEERNRRGCHGRAGSRGRGRCLSRACLCPWHPESVASRTPRPSILPRIRRGARPPPYRASSDRSATAS